MHAAFRPLSFCLLVLTGAVASAQDAPRTPSAASIAPAGPALGTVRIRIDSALGEQQAVEVRALLGKLPFVVVGEPADYIATATSDFPLDLLLVDETEPEAMWTTQKDETYEIVDAVPHQFSVGNLMDPDTEGRLRETLMAAARVRALLDRSFVDAGGISICLLRRPAAGTAVACDPMPAPGGQGLQSFGSVAGVRIRNGASSDRYVAMVATDHSLGIKTTETTGQAKVRRLAPGGSVDLNPVRPYYGQGTRILILSSETPFALEDLLQRKPLGDNRLCELDASSRPACQPILAGTPLDPTLAARSILFVSETEPMPAMGNGLDAIAGMASFVAQFYSIVPYTKAELDADAKLDDQHSQFLKVQTPMERHHRCGASLIGPNLIVTAAHCVAKGQYAGNGVEKMMTQRRIRLGSLKIGEGGDTYSVVAAAIHPGYDAVSPVNDIALLLIQPDRGTRTGRNHRSVAVAERPLPGGVKATAFGWGLTGSVKPNGNIMMSAGAINDHPGVLQYGDLYSVPYAACAKKLPGEVRPGMVCMYSKEALAGEASGEGVFTCRGDSGGPLIREVRGRDVLVGLVSWSKGCGYKTFPSVFTDVGSYSAWIAAARKALKPGLAIRPADPARPALGAGRTSP